MIETIDMRVVSGNMVNKYFDKTDAGILCEVVRDLASFSNNNIMPTELALEILRKRIKGTQKGIAKMLYVDCYAYIEYVAEVNHSKIANPSKPVSLCARRNSDTCAMYCDGFDCSCEMYKSSDDPEDCYIGTCSRFEENDEYAAIEVCSFEEGDPQ